MSGRFLITTADESTWKTDCSVLFLGEWCKVYNRRHKWQNLNADVVPYHWDSREKYLSDYRYLTDLYERILSELVICLNAIHSTDHSIRYWRILIGPWLGYFLQVAYDRWEMLQRAVQMYEISGSCIIKEDILQVIPYDMSSFNTLLSGDRWNQALYSYFIEYWTDIPIKVACHPEERLRFIPGQNSHIRSKPGFFNNFGEFIKKILLWGMKSNDAFFYNDNLSLQKSFQLQYSLGQVPQLWTKINPLDINEELCKRQWILPGNSINNFEKAVRSLIPLQVPSLYLEGYKQLSLQVSSLPWPQNPRFIFTCNSQYADDVFKAWMAEKVEIGASLVISQHGGHYGSGLFSFQEDHEISICDKFISWGWISDISPNIVPLVAGKLIRKGEGTWNPQGDALLVTFTPPRYSYFMFSSVVAGQWLDYFNELGCFIDYLPEEIKERVLIRQYQQDYGWNQKERWHEKSPDIRLDDGVGSIEKLIEKCRIYISTYNATTFLETLSSNIPTIIFWNPDRWELRDSAIPYFDLLKEVGIFHKSPKSAAIQVERAWGDVASWWYHSDVQYARRIFCNQFAKVPENPIEVLKQFINNI
jgi:putative transferase (TIGR04331 family)